MVSESLKQRDTLIMSRLTIDLSDQQHSSLKAVAALQGKSIRQYAIERLFPDKSDEDNAWLELKQLLNERIDQALSEPDSTMTIRDIFDEELAREDAA